MSFPMGAQSQQPMSELCLRFPDNVGIHSQISYEQAMNLLSQAAEMAQRVPFAWAYIDKPPDGQTYLIFFFPTSPTPMPPDGIRWLDQEKSYRLPVHTARELEVSEVKYGFAPGVEMTASRIRRRYRLAKGGNPQLMLIHYSRGDPITVPQHLINVPIRSYPLRPSNEPRLFVAGERMGQRVGPTNVPQPNGAPMNMPPHVPMAMGGMTHTAALNQQTHTMDALERERRNRAMAAAAQRPADEDDSGDEYENVTTRALAIDRFKRNHELMADVFVQASKGPRRGIPKLPSPYASLNLEHMNQQIEQLQSDITTLKAKAEEQRLAREAADASTQLDHREVEEIAPLGT